MNDLALIARAQNGCTRAADQLIRAHEPLAHTIANEFFHSSLTADDLAQHARLGILAAIHRYRPDRGAPFAWFAGLCARSAVIEAVRVAQRQKHRPLNDAISPTVTGDDGNSLDLFETIASPDSDPADIVDRRQQLDRLITAMGTLSPLERHWMVHVINGGTYSRWDTGSKTAENAVDRARLKLREAA